MCFMIVKNKSLSVTSGKQWQAFKIYVCLQYLICEKSFYFVINNKVKLNNLQKPHLQVSSKFFKGI